PASNTARRTLRKLLWALVVMPASSRLTPPPTLGSDLLFSIGPGIVPPHNPAQSGFRIIQMLRQQRSTLLKIARRQKLIQPPVRRNQSSGIVMTAIHQHHPHPQLANQLLIKRLQTPVAVEADQQSVEL